MGGSPANTISDAEWAKIIEAAKKEGKVTCYCFDLGRVGWLGDWAAREFKKTYGIELENIGATPALAVERIRSEARAGQYNADVAAPGAAWQVGVLEPGGFLKRIDNLPALKDVKDPSVWMFSPIVTPYTILRPDDVSYPGVHYTVNTNVVPKERYPQKAQDLLDPFWKGKVCDYEPLVFTVLDYKFWNNFREYNYAEWYVDFFYDLYNTGDRIFFTFVGAPAGLARGDCGINQMFDGGGVNDIKEAAVISKSPWLKGATYADGKPIPVVGSDSLGVLAKAPHPNAALLFANWRFTKEAQDSVAREKGGLTVSARLDAPMLLEKEYWPERTVNTYWLPDARWYDFQSYSYANKVTFKLAKQGMSREAWRKLVKDTSTFYWGQYPPPPATYFTIAR